MTRKYSSTSVETTLATGISSTATTMTVATNTAAALLGGQTLGPAVGGVYPDQFTVAIDPDTINEEIVLVKYVTSDTLTVTRGIAGTSAVTHSGGAVVRHVLTSNDLDYFTSGVDNAITLASSSVLTNKTIALGNNTISGSTAQFNSALTDNDFATLAGTETLSNKNLTSGTNTFPSTLVTTTGAQTLTDKTLTSPTVDDPKLNLSVNAQVGTTYTFGLTDNGKFITASNGSAQTYSIPTNSTTPFPIGTQIHIIQIGSGQVTIQAVTAGTTTVLSTGATAAAPKIAKQYGAATCIKTGTDTWYVIGNLS